MKKWLAGMALLASLSPLKAAEQQYDWSFRYFGDYWGPGLVDQTINGSFTVDDVDKNGQFDLSELKAIVYQGIDYASCAGCRVDVFSFVPGGTLDFQIFRSIDSGTGVSRTRVDVGYSYGYSFWPNEGGEPYEAGGRWVNETIATVTTVPEPHTYLMLGAGLLTLVGAARRRQRGPTA